MLETIHIILLAFGPRSKAQSPTFPTRSLSMVLWRGHLPLTRLRGKTSPPQQSKTRHQALRAAAVKEGLAPKARKAFALYVMDKSQVNWPWCFRLGDEATGERVGCFAFFLEGPLPWAQRYRISMPTRCAFARGHQGTSWPDQQASFSCAANGKEPMQKDHSWPIHDCSWSKWRRRECWLDSFGVGELWQGLPGSYPARTTMCSESF